MVDGTLRVSRSCRPDTRTILHSTVVLDFCCVLCFVRLEERCCAGAGQWPAALRALDLHGAHGWVDLVPHQILAVVRLAQLRHQAARRGWNLDCSTPVSISAKGGNWRLEASALAAQYGQLWSATPGLKVLLWRKPCVLCLFGWQQHRHPVVEPAGAPLLCTNYCRTRWLCSLLLVQNAFPREAGWHQHITESYRTQPLDITTPAVCSSRPSGW